MLYLTTTTIIILQYYKLLIMSMTMLQASNAINVGTSRWLSSSSYYSDSTNNNTTSYNSYNYNYYQSGMNSTNNDDDDDNSTEWWSSFFNQTSFNNDVNELSSNLHPASDVDVEGVLALAVFNAVVFLVFMMLYEFLRRAFPNVYASKQSREAVLEIAAQKRRQEELGKGLVGHHEGGKEEEEAPQSESELHSHQELLHNMTPQLMPSDEQSTPGNINLDISSNNNISIKLEPPFTDDPTMPATPTKNNTNHPIDRMQSSESDIILQNMNSSKRHIFTSSQQLPDVYKSEIPFEWIKPVYDISWRKVRKIAGLDAYFFLRYIRMCLKITSVSALWGSIILFPVYASGQNGATSWYHVSMANVSQGSKIIWVSVFFLYFFSAYVLFVMKQEYKHFVELRLDFLGKGDGSTDPQHHYSLMVENIPKELRSDSALFAYFEKLFPGKVHSANGKSYF